MIVHVLVSVIRMVEAVNETYELVSSDILSCPAFGMLVYSREVVSLVGEWYYSSKMAESQRCSLTPE
jgi:hypothetical protein